jgi:hypothetical protein
MKLKPGSYFWGLHMILVTQRGVQKILKFLDRLEGQMDAEYSWMIHQGLVVISAKEDLAVQDYDAGSALQVRGQVFTFMGKNGANTRLDGIF